MKHNEHIRVVSTKTTPYVPVADPVKPKLRKHSRTSLLKMLRLAPESVVAYYGLACLDAVAHKPDAAFGKLEKAAIHGFRDTRQLRREPDLQSLRHDPRWKAMFAFIANLKECE